MGAEHVLAPVQGGPVDRPLDFIVIGAAKSGTTTLFHHLRHHPGLFVPPDKERPFFSKDPVYLAGWDRYVAEVFADAPPEARWGKVTPRYLGDLHVPERMAAAMPDVRLHALLRNPVDRAYSKYRLNLRHGGERRPFAEVVADQLRPEALATARATTVRMSEAVVVRGEYGRLLRTYLDRFPAEQLLVHLTDELEADPQRVVDEVLVHVGLPGGWVPPTIDERFYVGGDEARFRWAPKVVGAVQPLWDRVPDGRRRQLRHWYATQLSVGRGKETPPPFPAETRARLVDFYRPDVERLERILGRPVPWDELRVGVT